MINSFLAEAKRICDQMQSNHPMAGGDYFDNSTYDVQRNMGFVKHAFVLFMYVLMRAHEKPIDEVYNWALY